VAECPTGPLGRTVCAQTLIDESAGIGVEIHVSTAPPLVFDVPHRPAGFRCPHGVDYWIEPTGEQRAQWVADRTL
jgi:hypothetical protein